MSAPSNNYQARIAKVVARIRQTCAQRAAEYPHDAPIVKLLAVSKTFPVSALMAIAACGIRSFGENYVQEGVDKILALKAQKISGLEWHFIGPIQSNKTRQIAEHFDWVQSVDRLKIAERLSAQRPENLPPLQILLQVNISDETSKSGFQPAELNRALQSIRMLPRLKVRGLMAIPAPTHNLAQQRIPLRAMKVLFDDLNAAGAGLDTLSMGMSSDFEAAILEGSSLVRIGSAIFGERT